MPRLRHVSIEIVSRLSRVYAALDVPMTLRAVADTV